MFLSKRLRHSFFIFLCTIDLWNYLPGTKSQFCFQQALHQPLKKFRLTSFQKPQYWNWFDLLQVGLSVAPFVFAVIYTFWAVWWWFPLFELWYNYFNTLLHWGHLRILFVGSLRTAASVQGLNALVYVTLFIRRQRGKGLPSPSPGGTSVACLQEFFFFFPTSLRLFVKNSCSVFIFIAHMTISKEKIKSVWTG